MPMTEWNDLDIAQQRLCGYMAGAIIGGLHALFVVAVAALAAPDYGPGFVAPTIIAVALLCIWAMLGAIKPLRFEWPARHLWPH